MITEYRWKYIHTSVFHIVFTSSWRTIEQFVLFKKVLIQISIGEQCAVHMPQDITMKASSIPHEISSALFQMPDLHVDRYSMS